MHDTENEDVFYITVSFRLNILKLIGTCNGHTAKGRQTHTHTHTFEHTHAVSPIIYPSLFLYGMPFVRLA